MPASPLSTDWLNMVATEVADLPSHRVTLSSTADALAMRKLQPGVGTLPYPSRVGASFSHHCDDLPVVVAARA